MAVALARELEKQKPGVEVLFVGAQKGMGNDIVPTLGFRFQTLTIGGFKGVGLFRAALTPPTDSWKPALLSENDQGFSPSLIVGLGDILGTDHAGRKGTGISRIADRTQCPTRVHQPSSETLGGCGGGGL